MTHLKLAGGLLASTALILGYTPTSDVSEEFLQQQLLSLYRVETIRMSPHTGTDVGEEGSCVAFKIVDNKDCTYTVYFLTAKHLLRPPPKNADSLLLHLINPAPGISSDKSFSTLRAEIVAEHPQKDIAVLRAVLPGKIPVVRLSADSPVPAEKVYAIGMPLGGGSLITDGYVGFRIDREKLKELLGDWVVSAEIMYGNSGGGVFRKSDGEMLGVSTKIMTMGTFGPPVAHIHIFTPCKVFIPWLKAEGVL